MWRRCLAPSWRGPLGARPDCLSADEFRMRRCAAVARRAPARGRGRGRLQRVNRGCVDVPPLLVGAGCLWQASAANSGERPPPHAVFCGEVAQGGARPACQPRRRRVLRTWAWPARPFRRPSPWQSAAQGRTRRPRWRRRRVPSR